MPVQLTHIDWAMKYILRDKKNFDVLEGFLSELLNDDIHIEDILESESNKEHQYDKTNRVDVRTRNSRGDIIIIEVQVSRELDYFHRILWGASQAVTQSIHEGQKYRQIQKVISITIAFFELGEGRDYIYHGTTSFRGIHYKDDVLQLTSQQQNLLQNKEVYEIYPEYYIIKVDAFNNEVKTNLDDWVYLFKNSQVRIGATAKGLDAAQQKLNILNLTEKEQVQHKLYMRELSYIASMNDTQEFLRKEAQKKLLAEGREKGLKKGRIEGLREGRAEGFKEGRTEGRAEGIKEGELKNSQRIAQEMLKEGDSVERIARITGLDPSEIETLNEY